MTDIAWAFGWAVIIGGAWATAAALFVAAWSIYRDHLETLEEGLRHE